MCETRFLPGRTGLSFDGACVCVCVCVCAQMGSHLYDLSGEEFKQQKQFNFTQVGGWLVGWGVTWVCSGWVCSG